MLTEKVLFKKAAAELIKVFGKSYLRENLKDSCQAYGFIGENLYQLFVGIKSSDDLPDRKANEKGWVVFGLVFLDTLTGTVKKLEYGLE